jgi:purine nucleoside phosphorylase
VGRPAALASPGVVGIITGSGAHGLPGLAVQETAVRSTPYGPVELVLGRFGDVRAAQVSRHGAGHARLSHQVNHRANIWALHEAGATAVIGCTACGAVDPQLELGELIVFDDLFFVSNRLPDGTLCTFFDEVGAPQRGHWALHGGPFSAALTAALLAAAADAGHPCRKGGVYGHVDGPRFNTPAEIAWLATCGAVAVSQTGGPETVLCGELELPYALIGFVTDHANDARPGQTTPVATLQRLAGRSAQVFSDVIGRALARLTAASEPPVAAGTMLRFGSRP